MTLVQFGSSEQFKECGFHSIIEQLKLKKLLLTNFNSVTSKSTVTPPSKIKLTLNQMKKMPAEDHRLYLLKLVDLK